MDTRQLPYLTADLPGIGGEVKQRLEDFRVDEIPLYQASGQGDHVYVQLRKAGIPTPAAVSRLARHMGVKPSEIGVAGLKDAHAVTTQYMSLEHADPEKLAAFEDPQIQILWTGRHRNKLRPGHLTGNRFAVRIRKVEPSQLPAARGILDVLVRRGVPNYFGSQRFGARRDTDLLGEALLKQDLQEFIELLLGRPEPDDPPDCRAARDAFENGFLDRALKRWPRHYANERKALSAYKKKKNPRRAMMAVDKRMRRFYVSAWQSALFNEVLARRIQSIDEVLPGDWAQKTDTGGVFQVEDVETDQPRAERFEISPTGPLFGSRCRIADGEPGRMEREILARHGLSEQHPFRVGPLKVKGTRRALRFGIGDADIHAGEEDEGSYLQLTFTAPSGCYATILLRELIKPESAGE